MRSWKKCKHDKKQVLVLFDQFVVKLDNWSGSIAIVRKKHNFGETDGWYIIARLQPFEYADCLVFRLNEDWCGRVDCFGWEFKQEK